MKGRLVVSKTQLEEEYGCKLPRDRDTKSIGMYYWKKSRRKVK